MEAGFTETSDEANLTFSKSYSFKDSDDQDKEVTIDVKYSREYPLIPPNLHDSSRILTSMHSFNGIQCWARYSDIFPQVGLGLIAPSFVEEQIKKLLDAHVRREYYTVNESPEFAAMFASRDAVDHAQFYVSLEVINRVIEAGSGKIISSTSDFYSSHNLYGVMEVPQVLDASYNISRVNNFSGSKRRVYFLNVAVIQHYDYRNDDVEFLYSLESASGIKQENAFLQNITDEIFIVIVFFNKHIRQPDIVVLRKNGVKLTLLPHARVSSRNVLFSRHSDEANSLAGKKIGLVGIGAIGSVLGMTLLQSGIDKLYITDPDYVDLENISRSTYSESHIGLLKTEAFKKCALNKHYDFLHRTIVSNSYTDVINENPDLLIICIGHLYNEYIISRNMRKFGFEKAVFVFGQNDSTWGGIYFQDDPSLGCQHCLFLHQKEDDSLQIPYVPFMSEAVGCGNPSYVSSPSDIALLANLASKLIIERLIQRQKGASNFFIWQSNPTSEALKDSHTERYSLKNYRITKHAGCEC